MEKDIKPGICWLRRDLRLYDHRVLSKATAKHRHVIVCFVYDRKILHSLSSSDKRISFIFKSLQDLNTQLHKHGSRLVTIHGDPIEVIPKLAKQLNASAVYAGADYEPYAKERDTKVKDKLTHHGVLFELIKDHVIFAENEILNLNHKPFQVFSAYKNAWLNHLKPDDYQDAKVCAKHLMPSHHIKNIGKFLELKEIGFEASSLLIQPGQLAGKKQLKKFASKMHDYAKTRDLLSDHTSMLSPHLRFGTLSIRELVRLSKSLSGDGAKRWLEELIWRDFYQMILSQFPYVADTAFQKKYRNIKWPGKSEHFKLWCEGKTGFPIVDAAMRFFNETGWMHNRLRMVVATFLVKDLLIDWRWGEKYFASKLLDYDLAANNGNWQWCASTGASAQPYFRVFNPILQSKKYDPQGSFIRAHLPERKHDSIKKIHLPLNPIIEHRQQTKIYVNIFKQNV